MQQSSIFSNGNELLVIFWVRRRLFVQFGYNKEIVVKMRTKKILEPSFLLLLGLLVIRNGLVVPPFDLLQQLRFLLGPRPFLFSVLVNDSLLHFGVVDGNAFEDLDHLDYLVVTILLSFIYLPLFQKFASEEVDHDLLLEVRALPQEVFVGGLWSIFEDLLMDSYAFWKSGRIDWLNCWSFGVVENRD